MLLFDYFLQHNRYISFAGIAFILAVAFLCSTNRSKIKWRLVLNGLVVQGLLAFFILKTSIGHTVFQNLSEAFKALYSFAGAGAAFVFGNLADASGAWAFIFAVQVISIIIFFGALMSLLFHLGVIQIIVSGLAMVIRPLLGTSGAETLCAASNSMLGQTEAPLLIKRYLKDMTDSEMMVVMVSGFATISGSLLAVYGSMGVPMVHLLSASVMAIPASLLIAKILMPETEKPKTIGGYQVQMKRDTTNVLDAISKGTTDGMYLAANVLAMLIAFISLIAMVNYTLASMHLWTLNQIFAKIFAPVAYLLGISSSDMYVAGDLLGQKLVINEFVAYTSMVKTHISQRSHIILTYALCGFANFSCIGIQIGGIGALAPEKRTTLTRLGMRALLGGTLANFLNAAIAALLI